MRETPRPLRFKSTEELKEAVRFNDFRYEPIDPHRDESMAAIRDSKNQITQAIKDDGIWSWVYEMAVVQGHPKLIFQIEMGEFLLDVAVDLRNDPPNAHIRVLNKQWAEERKAFIERIFDPHGFPE